MRHLDVDLANDCDRAMGSAGDWHRPPWNPLALLLFVGLVLSQDLIL